MKFVQYLSRGKASAFVAMLTLSAWASATPPAVDCNEIDSETARAVEARRVAIEQSENAWKAIVPVVVLARKASAKSALEEADKKLAALRAQAQRCEADDGR